MASARSYSLSELVERTGFDRRTIVYYIQSGLLPKVGRRGPNTRYPEECHTRLQFIRGVKTHQAEGRLLTATLAEIGQALKALEGEGLGQILERGLPPAEVEALFAARPEPSPDPMPDPAPGLSPTPAASAGTAAEVPAPPATDGPGEISARQTSQPAGDRRFYGLADAGIRQRFGTERQESRPAAAEGGSPGSQPSTFGTGEGAAAPVITDGGVAPPVELHDLGQLLRELELRPTLNARRAPPGSPEQWTEIPITSRVYLSVRGLSAEDAPLAESCARLLKRALRGR